MLDADEIARRPSLPGHVLLVLDNGAEYVERLPSAAFDMVEAYDNVVTTRTFPCPVGRFTYRFGAIVRLTFRSGQSPAQPFIINAPP